MVSFPKSGGLFKLAGMELSSYAVEKGKPLITLVK
jgi:hypothetical protein